MPLLHITILIPASNKAGNIAAPRREPAATLAAAPTGPRVRVFFRGHPPAPRVRAVEPLADDVLGVCFADGVWTHDDGKPLLHRPLF